MLSRSGLNLYSFVEVNATKRRFSLISFPKRHQRCFAIARYARAHSGVAFEPLCFPLRLQPLGALRQDDGKHPKFRELRLCAGFDVPLIWEFAVGLRIKPISLPEA
jgi:hypothetical protein